MYRKGLKVERLHTVSHVTPYNNGFHSCNAALVARELCKINDIEDSGKVILYMLLHDVAEGYTGDVPANVKREFPNVKLAMDEAELAWEEDHIDDMPLLTDVEMQIAKAADTIELGMYCLEELALGNTNLSLVLANVVNYLYEHKNIIGIEKVVDHFVTRGKL